MSNTFQPRTAALVLCLAVATTINGATQETRAKEFSAFSAALR